MRPDALHTLLKLRRRTVEEARAAMAEALRAQDAAEAGLLAHEEAIRTETDRAGRLDAGDGSVEMFAAWLPGARKRATEAQAALDHAVANVAEARAALALARAALEAAETLQNRALEAEAGAALRREQEALDDAGRRRR